MRPLFIPAGVLGVGPDVAALWAPILVEDLQRTRRAGGDWSADAIESLEKLVLVGDAFTNRRNTVERSDVSPVDFPRFEPVDCISVQTAAEIIGKSEQAITGRCRRGTLRAERDERGHWRIPRAAVEALKEDT